MKTKYLITLLLSAGIAVNANAAAPTKPPPGAQDVNVVNTPDVNVVNTPNVTVTNPQTPVTVNNVNPIPVNVQNQSSSTTSM